MSMDEVEARAILAITGSSGWPTVQKYLNRRLQSARDELEQVPAAFPAQVGRIQGQCEELRTFLSLAETAGNVLKAQTR